MYFLGKKNITYTSSKVRTLLNSSESDYDESDNDPTFKIQAGPNRDNHGQPVGKEAYSKTLSNKILSTI